MTLKRPLNMQETAPDAAIQYSALDDRALFSALFLGEGIVGAIGSLAVEQRGAGANMSVDVAAGWCLITGDDVSNQGRYLCENTATVNVVVPAAPVSGTRVHRVIARVKDKTHNGAYSTYEWLIELQQDSGSGTPALPNTAIQLALVTVGTSTTAITANELSGHRQMAQGWSSRPHQVASDAGRPPNPLAAETVYRTDRAPIREVYDGGAWRMDAGAAAIYKDRGSDLSRASTTTLSDDPSLTATLLANVTYVLDCVLLYAADAAVDFKFGFTVPSGSTLNGVCHNPPAAQAATSGDVTLDQVTEASNPIGGGNGTGTVMTAHIKAKVWSGSGGTFAIKWAQSASSTTATTLKQHSFMELVPRGT